MDNKDIEIVQLLQENSKTPIYKISRQLGIPATTVHNRIKRLEKNGIIRNYTINVDTRKLGKNISAFILVSLDYHALKSINLNQEKLVSKLRKCNEVDELAHVTGSVDLLVRISVRDIEELNRFVTSTLRNQIGVNSTKTLVVLKSI